MKIEVIHRQASDKETIDNLVQLLTQTEALLGRCQRELPDTKKYDRLADNISVMRGRITNAIDDCSNLDEKSNQSFEEKLANAIKEVIDISKSTALSETGASKSQQAIREEYQCL